MLRTFLALLTGYAARIPDMRNVWREASRTQENRTGKRYVVLNTLTVRPYWRPLMHFQRLPNEGGVPLF
jgi:hypothetical protein